MRNFARRINNIEPSIFSVMSKYAFENNAYNLGQGFPDFDGPEWIIESFHKAMLEGKNQYAPSQGIHSLRNNISDYYKNHYDLSYNFEKEIMITSGATEALYCSITALINEGDEVILFEPFYDSYLADIYLAGGIPRFVTLNKPDFSFNSNDLDNLINDKTKLIIVNNPHNPSGKVYTENELKIISEFAIKNDLFVISDEVYEFLTFDDAKHIPIATFPEMKERTITISSTGKTFSMTGWKIGYISTSEKILSEIFKVHQWTVFAVNTPGQNAMAYALSRLDEYLPEFRTFYKKKRDLILKELEKTKFKAFIPNGSYFLLAEIPDSNDIDLSLKLVKDYKIATIPTSVFYKKSSEGKSLLRLCFAKSDETIINGIKNLAKY
jgi:aspartate/methionine/tyrosine aminotransferase